MELNMPQKRHLPKLLACMTKTSLEDARNMILHGMELLDAKGIRRKNMPLDQCLIIELKESGYTESSNYLQDLLYDNAQLVAEDDIGIVVNLKNKEDYLIHISEELQKAEKQREKDHTDKESLILLGLAKYYAEKGKGILWLAEKFFLASIAVASQYLIDGGRLKGCCKYFYGKFLLDKFPGADADEPFLILTEVRDASIGKTWPLEEPEKDGGDSSPGRTLFWAVSVQLHRVLLQKVRQIFKFDCAKAERLSRLAERRARDANDKALLGEAVIQVGICQLAMNNLNNAQKTFERAINISKEINNVKALCETRMHQAAVMQRLKDYDTAARLLTEMGALAMESGLSWHLGRALHLLGELHLQRERPELGTQHLAEAFSCFRGDFGAREQRSEDCPDPEAEGAKDFAVVFNAKKLRVYKEDAEQSRLMMAISAGQEIMASYFVLLQDSRDCQVARTQVIEWKLNKERWWVKKRHHDMIPCLCKLHNRTGLDVLRTALERRQQEEQAAAAAKANATPALFRTTSEQEQSPTSDDNQKSTILMRVTQSKVKRDLNAPKK